jgi:hypothetical protein
MTPSSQLDEKVGFAEKHGPTVLLLVGVCLILTGVGAVFTSHQIIAGGMFTTGVVAIIAAVVISRMVGPFRIFFLSGNLRESGQHRPT